MQKLLLQEGFSKKSFFTPFHSLQKQVLESYIHSHATVSIWINSNAPELAIASLNRQIFGRFRNEVLKLRSSFNGLSNSSGFAQIDYDADLGILVNLKALLYKLEFGDEHNIPRIEGARLGLPQCIDFAELPSVFGCHYNRLYFQSGSQGEINAQLAVYYKHAEFLKQALEAGAAFDYYGSAGKWDVRYLPIRFASLHVHRQEREWIVSNLDTYENVWQELVN